MYERSASNEIYCASLLDLAITSQIRQRLNEGKIFLWKASPEYVAKEEKGGGTIDFLVPAK